MPVIVIPAAVAALLSLFSGVINIFMQLPNPIKYLTFYVIFAGASLSVPGTDISLASVLFDPLFKTLFGFFHIYVDYALMLGAITVLLGLYFVHFFRSWKR